MPAAVAIPLITAAVGAGTQIVGAKMQSGAARRVARTQTDAANYAADRQDAASQRAEAFQRQMAQNAYLNDEASRRGNYDQWAATEGRRGTIGELLGLGKRNIPAYVPGVDPGFEGSGASTSGPMPVPGSGRPQVDRFGRPLRPQAQPQGSVGSYLPSAPINPVEDAVSEFHTYEMDPAEVEAARRRKGGTSGSVGSYLRSA